VSFEDLETFRNIRRDTSTSAAVPPAPSGRRLSVAARLHAAERAPADPGPGSETKQSGKPPRSSALPTARARAA